MVRNQTPRDLTSFEPRLPDRHSHSITSFGVGSLVRGEPLSLRYWGTRGSVPSPGPTTTRYGGNTSCVEVEIGHRRFILDAGTGIRPLGEAIQQEAEGKKATLLLTHFHWDHIQGFPFFSPAYDPDFELRIIAPAQAEASPESLIRNVMGPIHFPLSYEAIAATLSYCEHKEGNCDEDGIRIRAMRMRHTDFTVGYRIEAPGSTVVFIPDNEIEGGAHPTPLDWSDRLAEFVHGADLLLHDGMFTEEEYRQRNGWGHSTYHQAIELAERAQVKELHFFHHAPWRTDTELDDLVQGFRESLSRRGAALHVAAAAEGTSVTLDGDSESS